MALAVYIPDHVIITEEDIARELEQVKEYYITDDLGGYYENKIIKHILKSIENLKKGDCFYPKTLEYNNLHDFAIVIWNILITLLDNYVIAVSETNPNDIEYDSIIGITKEAVVNCIIKHIDIDEFLKPYILEDKT